MWCIIMYPVVIICLKRLNLSNAGLFETNGLNENAEKKKKKTKHLSKTVNHIFFKKYSVTISVKKWLLICK